MLFQGEFFLCYVCISLDFVFVVGRYWLIGCSFLLIPFFAFCDFSNSDSSTLASIDSSVAYIYTEVAWYFEEAERSLSSIDGKTSTIISRLFELNDYARYLSGISVDSDNTAINTATTASNTASIDRKMDLLLNYVTNSSSASSVGVVYTNLAALVMGQYTYPMAMTDEELRNLYANLTGDSNPSELELSDFYDLYFKYGSWKNPYFDYALRLDFSECSWIDRFGAYDTLRRLFPSFYGANGIKANTFEKTAHDLYIETYAVKPLTELVSTFTNDAPSSASVFSTDSDGSPIVSQAGQGIFSSISSSLSYTVSTNIASVNDDPISPVENQSLDSLWSDASSSSPDNTELGQIVSSINDVGSSVNSQIQNAFDVDSPESITMSFNLPGFGGLQSQQADFVLVSPVSRMTPYINFFSAIAKLFVAFYFSLLVWNRVIKESLHGRTT